MTLRFTRSLEEMRSVLKDPSSVGPDPVYVVHKDLDNGWVNKTEIMAGTYNNEFAKTFGHYHADNKDEIYHIESGTGILLLQNDHEVFLITAKSGDEVLIPKEYGHGWINIGNAPLISYDNHQDPQDNYQIIAQKHGLAYYLLSDNGQPVAVPNPHYQNLPQPKWLTAEQFNGQKT